MYNDHEDNKQLIAGELIGYRWWKVQDGLLWPPIKSTLYYQYQTMMMKQITSKITKELGV